MNTTDRRQFPNENSAYRPSTSFPNGKQCIQTIGVISLTENNEYVFFDTKLAEQLAGVELEGVGAGRAGRLATSRRLDAKPRQSNSYMGTRSPCPIGQFECVVGRLVGRGQSLLDASRVAGGPRVGLGLGV